MEVDLLPGVNRDLDPVQKEIHAGLSDVCPGSGQFQTVAKSSNHAFDVVVLELAC